MADKTLSFAIDITGVSQEAAELAKVELGLKNITKERNDYIKLLQQVEKVGGKLTKAQITELAALNTAVKNQTDTYKGLKKVVDTADDSLDRMRSDLVKMKTTANSSSAEIRTKMSPAIKKLTADISKAEEAQGTYTRSVGHYSNALQGIPGPIGMAVSQMQRLTVAAKAFIATPVGIVIAAIVAAFGALTAWFRRTEEGQGALNKIMKTFGVILQNIFDVVSKVGKAIFDAFSKPKELIDGLGRGIKNVFKGIKDLATGEKTLKDLGNGIVNAFNKAGKAIKGFIEDTKDEIKIARELADLENQNIIKTRELGIERAKIQARIDKLREDAEKRDEYAAEQRIKFTDEAIALEDKLYEKEKVLAEERLRIQRSFNEMSDSNRADKQAEADLEIALINLESERDRQQRSIIAKRQALIREQQKEEKAAKIKRDKGPERIGQLEAESLNVLRDYTGLTFEEIKRRNEGIEILEQAHADAKFQIASSATNLINSLAGKNKSLQKASLVADRALAIAEIIIQTKKANAATRAWGALGGPIGMVIAEASIIKNNIAAGINIAAVIAAAAAGLIGFKKGGKINRGIPINTGTADNKLIAVNDTETVLTSKHVAMLGGSGTMKRIGVPGYAEGGYIGQQAPVIPPVGFDYERLARLIPKHITLDINKIRSSLDEVEIITTTQKI